jgi:hypothetical protein
MNKIVKSILKLLFLTIFALLINTNNYCQIGYSISLSIDKVLGANLFYTKNMHGFYLGFSNQFNGQKKTVVRERKDTYGLTPIGDGEFYWLIDLGYSRSFSKVIVIQPEVSIGGKNYFTNYKDRRFKDNGYTLINHSEKVAGVGINMGYIVNSFIEPYIGFHTMKKLTFGIRIHLNF